MVLTAFGSIVMSSLSEDQLRLLCVLKGSEYSASCGALNS